MTTNHFRLGQVLAYAAADLRCPLKELTVLATQHDPFRVDTPARDRDGEWLAVTARALGVGDRRIHLRWRSAVGEVDAG